MRKSIGLLLFIFLISCDLIDYKYYDNLRDPLYNYEQFWQDLNDYYGLIDFKSRNHLDSAFGGWDGLYEDHKRYINSQMSERQLFAVLSSVLYNLYDAHSYWMKNRAPEYYYFLPDKNDFPHPPGIPWGSEPKDVLTRDSYGFNAYYPDLRIPKEYLSQFKYYEKDILFAGIVDQGRVEDLSPLADESLNRIKKYGYISIQSFIKYDDLKNFNAAQNWAKKIDDVLDDLMETDGIIIDIRHNTGGYEGNLELLLSRFVKERKHTYVSFTRNDSFKNSFDRVEYYITPANVVYNKPIILLTDRSTSSSGDLFALALKDEEHVITLGQNTHGILSKVVTRELPIGWSFRISSGFTLSINGVNYEEVGIPPEILISKELVNDLYHDFNNPVEKFFFYDPIFCKGVEALDLKVSRNWDLNVIRDNL